MKKKSKTLIMPEPWTPTRPPSSGAQAYHAAVANTSWHKQNIRELIKIIKKKIKENDIVVDFGAGTGSSAIYILKDIKKKFRLLLVDNSPSWLTKAYELLSKNSSVDFFCMDKKNDVYITLDQLIGKDFVNHVISANTVHLIPNIKETFYGIYSSLKKEGTFTFQSGNIKLVNKKNGVLMIDDSIKQIHDLAIKIIKNDDKFSLYKKGLDKRIKEEKSQRKFVFPTPRPLELYNRILKDIGFKNIITETKLIKVKYDDWLKFLRVRRLQAGILPEVGGKDASSKEEKDRDTLITKAALELFGKLKRQNRLAKSKFFTAQWVYVHAKK